MSLRNSTNAGFLFVSAFFFFKRKVKNTKMAGVPTPRRTPWATPFKTCRPRVSCELPISTQKLIFLDFSKFSDLRGIGLYPNLSGLSPSFLANGPRRSRTTTLVVVLYMYVYIYVYLYIYWLFLALILKGKTLLTPLQNHSVCVGTHEFWTRKISISKRQKATSAIRRRNDSNSLLSKRAGKEMQKSRFSPSEAHGCRPMLSCFSVLL